MIMTLRSRILLNNTNMRSERNLNIRPLPRIDEKYVSDLFGRHGTVHGSYKQGPGPAQPSWKHLIICYVCCMQCYKTVIVTFVDCFSESRLKMWKSRKCMKLKSAMDFRMSLNMYNVYSYVRCDIHRPFLFSDASEQAPASVGVWAGKLGTHSTLNKDHHTWIIQNLLFFEIHLLY